jgi:hypothetical protein
MHKLIDGEISAPSPGHEHVVLHLHGELFRPKEINSILLLLEQIPEHFAIGVIRDEVSQLLINNIDVFTDLIIICLGLLLNSEFWGLFSRLEHFLHFLHDEGWLSLLLGLGLCLDLINLRKLRFSFLQLFKQLQRYFIALKNFLLHGDDVLCAFVQIILKLRFLFHCLIQISFELLVLIDQKICLLIL